MYYLSEDPTFLAGSLLLLAGFFVIALKTTQAGKYLLGAATALVLSVGVVMVEWMWVTDNERIEKVVYDLRAAVLSGNAEGVLAHLAPNVMYQQGDIAREPEATRSLIRASLNNVHLEFVRISELRTSVGQHTRKGIAEFRAITKGSLRGTSTSIDGMSMTSWSLGFQETEPGVWKINRISPGAIPTGILTMPGGSMPSDGSRIGRNDASAIPGSEPHQFPRNIGGRSKRRLPGTRTQTN